MVRGHGYEGGQGHLVHVEEIKMRPFSFTQVLAINNFLSLWIALFGVWVGMAAMLWQASLFLSALGGHSTGRWGGKRI